MADMPRVYSREEVAEGLGLHLQTVGYHINKQHLRPSIVLGGNFGFTEKAILTFVKWHNVRAKVDTRYKMIEWKPLVEVTSNE